MTGEEITGPAGPKILRLLYFVGAGFICSAAINKWRELERKSLQKKQQDINLLNKSENEKGKTEKMTVEILNCNKSADLKK